MKEITVISGKGGTGKTSLTAALAVAGSNLVMCDCDVDAADLHLILKPEILESHIFEGAYTAEIDPEKCIDCELCSEYCRFDAIHINSRNKHEIDPYLCEGCRLCERICPSKAITSTKSRNNSWHISNTRRGPMVHAQMGPGEENSGKLVTEVRRAARELAKKSDHQYILNDGPPGTGCATIASITGTDAVLIILEPSITSLHDASRVAELVRKFKIPMFALINKASINPEMVGRLKEFLEQNAIPLLGEIPFERNMVKALIKHQTINEYEPESNISGIISSAWLSLST